MSSCIEDKIRVTPIVVYNILGAWKV